MAASWQCRSSGHRLRSSPSAVVLVGFHHSLGPVVDCSYPPSLKDDDDIVKNLPFLALPDGAHLVRMHAQLPTFGSIG